MPARIRVGYDASVTLAPSAGGIARYTLAMLRALVALDDPEIEFHVLLNSFRHGPREAHQFLFSAKNVRVIERNYPGPLIVKGWKRIEWPSWERLTGLACDLVHSPSGYLPPSEAPLVVTVHDLAFLRDRRRMKLAGGYFQDIYERKLGGCAAIITPSRHVASQVASIYTIPPERIIAIHSGIDASLFQPNGSTRAGLGVLAVTQQDIERKRPDWVVEIARRAQQRMPDSGIVFNVLGIKGQPDHPTNVACLPFLADEELAACYRGAAMTLLTTREEGFGFPLLESLACGTRVVCGRNSSLAEIGGGFPDYVDTGDINSYVDAICRLYTGNPDERWRNAAHEHAAQFTWERTALQVASVYRRVVQHHGH